MRATPPQLDSSDLGSPKQVWSLLCEKDERFQRNPKVLERHPKLKENMRSMLVEWLMEVCADRHLHRETFHLCVDYLDRYMEKTRKIEPGNLQMVASTALVIASKMEEIYPPKIHEIADYTDGCCTEENIRHMEEIMLEKLDWSCTPITAVHWLGLYLQLMNTSDVASDSFSHPKAPKRPCFVPPTSLNSPPKGPVLNKVNVSPSRLFCLRNEDDEEDSNSPLDDFFADDNDFALTKTKTDQCDDAATDVEPVLEMSYVGFNSYSDGHLYPDQRCTVPKLMRDEFVRLAKIIDLAILDNESLNFKYSELAAAVVACCYEPEDLILEVTGFRTSQLAAAIQFIEPFVRYCEDLDPGGVAIPHFSDVYREDYHNIQILVCNAIDHLKEIQQIRWEDDVRRKQRDEANFHSRKRKFPDCR